MESVTTALQRQPKLGHLMGRLCSLQHLLSHDPEVYGTLLSCVQTLRTEIPRDGMQKKAKNWAESQIRHTVSFYNQSNPGVEVAESVGFTALEYNTLSTDQLILSIQQDLEYLLEQQTQLLLGIDSGNNLLAEVSELCLPLLSNASSKRLLECLVLLNGRSSDGDKVSDLFLDRVTDLQTSAYSPDCNNESSVWRLEYEALVSLWLQHLPALEQEILLLIRAYTGHLHHHGRRTALEVICSRELPRACAEHTVLYKAVDLCIQQVLWETRGCQHVVRFMHLFQVAVNEAILQTPSPQIQVTVHTLFPQRLHPLVNLLSVDPKVLPQEAQVIHLPSIHSTLLTSLKDAVVANNPREMFAIWTVLVKFESWYYAAISVLVRGGFVGQCNVGGLGEACLGIIAWFTWPMAHTIKNNAKELIQDIAETLHSCMMGSVFKSAELKRTLSMYLAASPETERKGDFVGVCTALMMSALYQSPCVSPDNVMEILDLLLTSVRASTSSYHKLIFLLDYTDLLQAALPDEVSGVGFHSGIPAQMKQAVRNLVETLDKDVAEGRTIMRGKSEIDVLRTRCNEITR